MKVCLTLLVLSLVSCILAHPYTQLDTNFEVAADDLLDYDADTYLQLPEAASEQDLHRARRQLNIQGGGSSKQGIDLNIQAKAPVWQSPNGRHSVAATGQYSQHLGGPYGNSKPNYGGGAVYTFKF